MRRVILVVLIAHFACGVVDDETVPSIKRTEVASEAIEKKTSSIAPTNSTSTAVVTTRTSTSTATTPTSTTTTTSTTTPTPATTKPAPKPRFQVLINPYYAILLKSELGVDDCSDEVHINFTITLLDRDREVVDKSDIIEYLQMVDYQGNTHHNACVLLFVPSADPLSTPAPNAGRNTSPKPSVDTSSSGMSVVHLADQSQAQPIPLTPINPRSVMIAENSRVQFKIVVRAHNASGSVTFIDSVYAWQHNFWKEKARANVRGHTTGQSSLVYSYYARYINETCMAQGTLHTRTIRQCPAWVETSLWFVLLVMVCALQFAVLIGGLCVWSCVDWSNVYKVQRRKRRRHKRKLKQHELEVTYNAVAVEQSHDDANQRLSDEEEDSL